MEIQEHDFVATRQDDGRYMIRQYLDRKLVTAAGHEETYDEAEMLRRLAALRPEGDGWIDDGMHVLRLVQP